MTATVLHTLKYGTLSECYKNLSMFNSFNFTSEDLNELRKLLPVIVTKTRAFVCTIKSSYEFIARVMKSDYHSFIKALKENNDVETLELVKELESLWTAVENFFNKDDDLITNNVTPVDLKELIDMVKTKTEGVKNAVHYIKDHATIILNNADIPEKQKEIREMLQKTAHMLPYVVFEMTLKLLFETFFVLHGSRNNWKVKLFVYDQKTKCSILFYNAKYFVDHYGNVYSSEQNFLQTLRKFTGFFDFTDHDGNGYQVILLDNETFLKMLQYELKKMGINSSSLAFFENPDTLTITALKNMKAFFHFFKQLEYHVDRLKLKFSFDSCDEIKISNGEISYKVNVEEFITDYNNFENFFNFEPSKFATQLCNKNNCNICKFNRDGDCEREGAIFCLTCMECGAQFIGATERKAHYRINENLRAFRNPTAKSYARNALAKHNIAMHNGQKTLEISVKIISFEVDDRKRKSEKKRLIKHKSRNEFRCYGI